MNDIKIACPGCGQHIACDDTWAGRQIACPTCQQPLVIPPASATPAPRPVPPAGSASVPSPIPLPSPPAKPPTPPASGATRVPAPRPTPVPQPKPRGPSGKTSGLAIASLLCSIGTCLLGPFGSLPGIILGHMAKSRLRRDPSLRGSGLATAGLVIGYLFGALWAVWFVLFGLAWISAMRSGNSPNSPTAPFQQNINPGPKSKSGIAKPFITAPDVEPKLEMPAGPVSGKIGSLDFICEDARLGITALTLRQGADIVPAAEITVTLPETRRPTLGGRTFTVAPGARGRIPQVDANWVENGTRQTLSGSDNYRMTLHFDAFGDNTVTGNIDLQIPGKPCLSVKGNFLARLR